MNSDMRIVNIIYLSKTNCQKETSLKRSELLHSYSFHFLPLTEKEASLPFHLFLTDTSSQNFFSQLTFCCHIYYSLNKTTITAIKCSALQTSCQHIKLRDKEKWGLRNSRKSWPNLQILNWHKQHATKYKQKTLTTVTYTTYITSKNQTKDVFVDD
jgi:hypothetical protein